jgi:hypothetical protein
MALTGTFEVRGAGSDANGGIYDSALAGAGTDYSQQNAPQLSLSDVVTTSASATATSTTGGFTSAMIANGFNIAGTIYIIIAVASTNSVTLDRTVTTGATGQVGNVGGALGTPGYWALMASLSAQGTTSYFDPTNWLMTNTTNIAGGKVNITSGGTVAKAMRIIGYGASRTDQSFGPTLRNNTGGIAAFNCSTAGGLVIVDNFIFDGQGGSSSGIAVGQNHRLRRVKVMNFVGTGLLCSASGTFLHDCEVFGCTNGMTGRPYGKNVSVHNNTASGVVMSTTGITTLTNWAIYSNAGVGISAGALITLDHCSIYNNGTANVQGSGSSNGYIALDDCIIYGAGTYNVQNTTSNDVVFARNCAVGGSVSGNFGGSVNQDNIILLTANPFNLSTSSDFTLNNVAGGGALCRASGFSGNIYFTTTTSSGDLGAAQHASTGGSVGVQAPIRGNTWSFVG